VASATKYVICLLWIKTNSVYINQTRKIRQKISVAQNA
jgi:hypothetical protein